MIYSEEGFEEEQMSELDCESVSDLIAEIKRLREAIIEVAFDEHESVYEMKQALAKVIE